MKKLLLPLAALLLGGAGRAQAQAGSILDLVRLGTRLAAYSATAPRYLEGQLAVPPATPAELVTRRTPPDRLPQRGAAEVVQLEAALEQCHAALLASPTARILVPERLAAVRAAAVAVARAAPHWELYLYQQEAAYYAAEDARRQQPPAPTN